MVIEALRDEEVVDGGAELPEDGGAVEDLFLAADEGGDAESEVVHDGVNEEVHCCCCWC